jgi:hypothetical protein
MARQWIFRVFAGSVVAVGGCTSNANKPGGPTTSPSTSPGWFTSFTAEQAQALTPDEAKAVLIARTAIEKQLPEPIPLAFELDRGPQGFSVKVTRFQAGQFGAKLFPMGRFAVVYIDNQWNVVGIEGAV